MSRVQLVGDNDPAVTLEFEGYFAARIPIVTGATGHREYHVLAFETTDTLRVDFGPSCSSTIGGVRYVQPPRLWTGPGELVTVH